MSFFGSRNKIVGLIDIFDLQSLGVHKDETYVVYEGKRLAVIPGRKAIEGPDSIARMTKNELRGVYNVLVAYFGGTMMGNSIFRSLDFPLVRSSVPLIMLYIDNTLLVEKEIEVTKEDPTEGGEDCNDKVDALSHEIARVTYAVDKIRPVVVVGAGNPLAQAVSAKLIDGCVVGDVPFEDMSDKGYWFFNPDNEKDFSYPYMGRGYFVVVSDEYRQMKGDYYYYRSDNFWYYFYYVGYNKNKMPQYCLEEDQTGWGEVVNKDDVYAIPDPGVFNSLVTAQRKLGFNIKWSSRLSSLVPSQSCVYNRLHVCAYDSFIYEGHARYYDMRTGVIHPLMMGSPSSVMRVIEGTFVRVSPGDVYNLKSSRNYYVVIRRVRELWLFRDMLVPRGKSMIKSKIYVYHIKVARDHRLMEAFRLKQWKRLKPFLLWNN